MSEFNEHKAHFGPISKDVMDYVTNEVLLRSRYLFTQTSARIQFAYCTHFNQRHKPEIPLKHNSKAVCPKCNSTCTVKKSHVGRKYMVDKAYVVYYQKSILDPTIMTAMGLYVQRDYRGDFKKVETLYRPSCSYVFQMGRSSMFYTGYYNQKNWYENKNITSEYSLYKNGTPCYYSRESIRKAIEGTPFQYSTWDEYDEQDMTKFFGLYSKYPCIEYLTKMGYKYFVHAKLYGAKTYGAIKWSGKSVEQILKLNKQDLREIRQHDDIDALTLRLYQITRKDNNRPSLKEIKSFVKRAGDCFEELKPMLKFQNFRRCVAYMDKQIKKNPRSFRRSTDVLTMWKDYISDCKNLGLDLKRSNIVFPSNLHKAHQDTIKQVEIKVSIEAERKIKERSEILEKLKFSYNGFIVRAAKSAKEIIDEGKALSHCVGNYASDHADGKTNILMIRKVADPETPFYTMEVKDGRVVQTYGYDNFLPTGDVLELIDRFKLEKLAKARKRTPQNRAKETEAAV
ncbi:PcfJ domain-containing protein [Paenibacillus sp. HGF5]|uniref:PcfJ domain-containing protein n=1 Tax=Paenibacillus sp. HGF5 TaxID=908341 RepID=UPI0002072675|nr:PcfJ domain-containing protein [Paenibacillus sp. HGF5]EGG33421.1 hypothetical protein HMPREF9412_1421 [Paenibacillus sp. HGF5]